MILNEAKRSYLSDSYDKKKNPLKNPKWLQQFKKILNNLNEVDKIKKF